MKGFVLSINRAKNEDTIAVVLSSNDVRSYYRFFGARHSILQLGYLIDFEIEGDDGKFLPRLRSLSQIPFEWIYNKNRLMIWQNYIKLFARHLQDASEIDSFYYDLLLWCATRLGRQNPKRVVCDSYLRLLNFEGRLHYDKNCFVCEMPIENQISLMQGFRIAHPHCIYAPALPTKKLLDTFNIQKSLLMDDSEIDYMFDIIMRGL
jgi:hypothetical protein